MAEAGVEGCGTETTVVLVARAASQECELSARDIDPPARLASSMQIGDTPLVVHCVPLAGKNAGLQLWAGKACDRVRAGRLLDEPE